MKTKKQIFIKRVATTLLATVLLSMGVPAQSAHAASMTVMALDTVAGFETMVKVMGAEPLRTVHLVVSTPEGKQLNLYEMTNDEGTAQLNVPDSSTERAGLYRVRDSQSPVQSSFTVFPTTMSPDISRIEVRAADADSRTSNVTVTILDAYGNPLRFHQVRLRTSHKDDRVVPVRAQTDAGGAAHFTLSSQYSGKTNIEAIDESVGELISSHSFAEGAESAFVFNEIGGDPEMLVLAETSDATTPARFEIDNIPASAVVNEQINFRLSAVDANGALVTAYRGTVHFSSTDPNGNVPANYTFTDGDQGRKTFDLGLSLRAVGNQTLRVVQVNNELIKGEKQIEIRPAQQDASSGEVRITKPATGTYSVNTLEVAGEASPTTRVKIFDNGQQIAEVQSNSSGRFTFTTSLLTDGQHSFQAESNGIQSNTAVATIDSTPARVEEVQITETTLAPGASTTITVKSDPDLNSLQATVGKDFITDLRPDPTHPGTYTGTLIAPAEDGTFTVNLILTDKVGNVSPAAEGGTIRVDSNLRADATFSFNVPSKVKGLQAQASNKKVNLAWQAAQAESGIALYRVYYGTSANNLNLVVSTSGPQTNITVENLLNETQYFFRVTGVDTQGNEGDNLSDIVESMPSESAAQSDQNVALCDPAPCPTDIPYPDSIPEDGPAVWGMALASIVSGAGLRLYRRRRSK